MDTKCAKVMFLCLKLFLNLTWHKVYIQDEPTYLLCRFVDFFNFARPKKHLVDRVPWQILDSN